MNFIKTRNYSYTRWYWIILATLAVSLIGLVQAFHSNLCAAVILVDSSSDVVANDGSCSLREAIENANGNMALHTDCVGGQPGLDRIDFDFNLAGTSIILNGSELPQISDALFIRSPRPKVHISGDNQSRIFQVEPDTRLGLKNLVIESGDENGSDCGSSPEVCRGGAINNHGILRIEDCLIRNSVSFTGGGGINNDGKLWLIRSTVWGNTSFFGGGGIFNFGSLIVDQSTIANNYTPLFNGAGIWNWLNAVAFIENSTISSNTGFDDDMGDLNEGGGIFNDGILTVISSTITKNLGEDGGGGISNSVFGKTTLRNSIIAGNRVSATLQNTDDCASEVPNAIISQGYNLFGENTGCSDLNLTDLTVLPSEVFSIVFGPLANNGGGTPTHNLLPGSPGIDAANPGGCVDKNGILLDVDQRGFDRHVNSLCDIGAIESQTP